MILIGITGKAGAGKDTIADHLVADYGFTKLSFAGPLKAMLAAAGLAEPADRALKEQPVPGFDFTWREAAQKLGTEWGRGLDPEIWIKLARQQVVRGLGVPGSGRYVFADVRFENEAAMIRAMGGRVLHVLGRQADLGANAAHSSEAGVLFYPTEDALVHNTGSIEATLLLVAAEMVK